MPDIALSCLLSRDLLALGPLEIAASPYYLSPQFLGAQVQWSRQKVSSPFSDGELTVQRSRQNVTEQIGVEIVAADGPELQAATAVLIEAFVQDRFFMYVTADGATYAYDCEAADYQVASWSTARLSAKHGQVLFAVTRQPVAILGGV